MPAPLVLAMHGTRSAVGQATLTSIAEAVAAARDGLMVTVAYLDVIEPTLSQILDRIDEPAVVVPGLLSTGYHVTTDIPAVVASRPGVRVARHLGPDDRLTTALVDRIGSGGGSGRILLAATGSSRPEAAQEVAVAATKLAAATGQQVLPVSLTNPLGSVLRSGDAVATYLLAEGWFYDRAVTEAAGHVVTPPIGAHPCLVELILARYDEVAATG